MENLFSYDKNRIYFQVYHPEETNSKAKNDRFNRIFFCERDGLFSDVRALTPNLSNLPKIQSDVLRGNFYDERYDINRNVSDRQYVMQVQRSDGSKVHEDLIDLIEDVFLIYS